MKVQNIFGKIKFLGSKKFKAKKKCLGRKSLRCKIFKFAVRNSLMVKEQAQNLCIDTSFEQRLTKVNKGKQRQTKVNKETKVNKVKG